MEDKQVHLEKIQRTLAFIANKLNLLNIKWVLGASGALMVHGINIIPWDLDIFTNEETVRLLENKFKEHIVNPLHYFDQKNHKELEFQMKINDIEIEVCEPCDFSLVQTVNFNNIPIPVNSLKSELEFYSQRIGKEEIIKQIKEKLSAQ